MATPRSQLIDSEYPMHYHLVSRCVRKSWLCGLDPKSRKNYEHRKTWLRNRLLHLARCFAVAIDAYAIMSNHFHLVVYFDPRESFSWSDEEVADRWLAAFPPHTEPDSAEKQAILDLHRAILLQMPNRILHARKTLGSLSMFMKHLKQPIARQANKEDQCLGHFFEGRFYSGALLDESAVIAAMAYVDLNPVRARIVQDISKYEAASGFDRSKLANNTPRRLAEAIQPLVSGLTRERPAMAVTLNTYFEIIKNCSRDYATNRTKDKNSRWFDRIASLKKRQRAFGSRSKLSSWRTDRGWSDHGSPLPAA
jgi:REP element-mobilizing transposase RayT